MESVASKHLLGNLANAPNIAALARSAMVFDDVYAVSPATERSHFAINAGGFHMPGDGVQPFQTLDGAWPGHDRLPA